MVVCLSELHGTAGEDRGERAPGAAAAGAASLLGVTDPTGDLGVRDEKAEVVHGDSLGSGAPGRGTPEASRHRGVRRVGTVAGLASALWPGVASAQ
jgi:hypothetical protein